MAAAPPSEAPPQCPHCLLRGAHRADACPSLGPALCAAAEAGCAGIPLSRAVLPAACLPSDQLLRACRGRPDVPPFLRCGACGLLAAEPVWCQRCDGVACAACLAPTEEEEWACPSEACTAAEPDAFHVVGPLRAAAEAWLLAAAMAVDAVTLQPVPASAPAKPRRGKRAK